MKIVDPFKPEMLTEEFEKELYEEFKYQFARDWGRYFPEIKHPDYFNEPRSGTVCRYIFANPNQKQLAEINGFEDHKLFNIKELVYRKKTQPGIILESYLVEVWDIRNNKIFSLNEKGFRNHSVAYKIFWLKEETIEMFYDLKSFNTLIKKQEQTLHQSHAKKIEILKAYKEHINNV